MRYRISFLALRYSAIITMPYYIQRDQNWAILDLLEDVAGGGGGGGGGGGWINFPMVLGPILPGPRCQTHLDFVGTIYYIGNQLAAINFFLHVLYISEGGQCATCCVGIDFSNVQLYLLSFSHTIANSCIMSCLLSNNSQQTSTS